MGKCKRRTLHKATATPYFMTRETAVNNVFRIFSENSKKRNDLKIAIGNDGDLNNKQKSLLLSLGFKELRDNVHPIYEIKGHKFIMCSTSSDQRNGKKKFNQMKRTLCVYKYTDNN